MRLISSNCIPICRGESGSPKQSTSTWHWRARTQLRTRKSASAFLHGRALVNPEIESKRMYMYVRVYVFLFVFSLSLSLSPLGFTPASVTAVERDGDALFPPPLRSFHLFRSRHCMPRGDELSLPPSLFICYPLPLFFSLPLCHPCSSWQIRAVDESTRRYLDVSASTRLMRDADVFIHRRTFPILTNDAPHRTLLVWIPCCLHDFSPAIRETNSAFLKRKFNMGKDQLRAWRQKLWI